MRRKILGGCAVVLVTLVAAGALIWASISSLFSRIAEQEAEQRAALLDAMPLEVLAMVETVNQLDDDIEAHDSDRARHDADIATDRFAPYAGFNPAPDASGADLFNAQRALNDRQVYIRALTLLETKGLADHHTFTDYDTALAGAGEELSYLTEPFGSSPAVRELGRAIGEERKRITSKVLEERKEAELAARCGPPPEIIDGKSFDAEFLMAQRANDPGSITSSLCTQPKLTGKCWRTTCLIRGKNAFGALVADEYTFHIGEGKISVEP